MVLTRRKNKHSRCPCEARGQPLGSVSSAPTQTEISKGMILPCQNSRSHHRDWYLKGQTSIYNSAFPKINPKEWEIRENKEKASLQFIISQSSRKVFISVYTWGRVFFFSETHCWSEDGQTTSELSISWSQQKDIWWPGWQKTPKFSSDLKKKNTAIDKQNRTLTAQFRSHVCTQLLLQYHAWLTFVMLLAMIVLDSSSETVSPIKHFFLYPALIMVHCQGDRRR